MSPVVSIGSLTIKLPVVVILALGIVTPNVAKRAGRCYAAIAFGCMRKIALAKSPDPVRVQIAVTGKKPIGVRMTRDLMNDIINTWVETGKTPRGLRVVQVRWLNPKRVNSKLAQWKEATTPGAIRTARKTLRLAQLLQGGMRFSSVGYSKGVRPA